MKPTRTGVIQVQKEDEMKKEQVLSCGAAAIIIGEDGSCRTSLDMLIDALKHIGRK